MSVSALFSIAGQLFSQVGCLLCTVMQTFPLPVSVAFGFQVHACLCAPVSMYERKREWDSYVCVCVCLSVCLCEGENQVHMVPSYNYLEVFFPDTDIISYP